ncbi:MAG TPA: spondin domain-containing protein [Enhygromyxa sp.]|nr:spondin domain-containing protein [Enhygromyxa sp.]
MHNSMTGLMCVSAMMLCACNEPEGEEQPQEFIVTVANLTPAHSLFLSGRFDTPDSELLTAPLAPGDSYRFDVVAWPGSQLQIITMFVESNDAFVAFAPGGIALWTPDGEPLIGDRSEELVLYDAGTEVNEPLAAGSSQPRRQLEPGQGQREDGTITAITDGEGGAALGPDGVEFPAIADFMQLHVIHVEGPNFRVIISNVSSNKLLADPADGPKQDPKPALLSPGIYTVHQAGFELFTVGEPATPQLERLVEDIDPEPLADQLDFMRGVTSDLSGVVWAVHGGEVGLYGTGSRASAGLEKLIEDGRAQLLVEQLAKSDEFAQVGLAPADGSVLEPGAVVQFRFAAWPGDHLSFVSGYLATNDKFVASTELGIPLFDEDGVARTGELDWALGLFDAGTEVDEPPGLGANQFERQSRRGAGLDENEIVREIYGEWNGWEYPRAGQIIGVRIDLIPQSKPNSGP